MAYQFPAPGGDGDEFLAPNNVLYVYNAADGQWEVKGIVDPILPDPTDDTQQPGTTDDRYVNITGDEMEGPLNVVHPPTEDNHASSKKYVDEITQGLCWEPFNNAGGSGSGFEWIRPANGAPNRYQVQGNKNGQSAATDITALTFHVDTDISKVVVGRNMRLRIGGKIDEFEITGINGHTLSVSLVSQGSSGTPYYYQAPLKISYQIPCPIYVERTGDKMTGNLELEDGFGSIQVFDDTTPEQTAVHKKYVDDSVYDRVARAGDTMTGTLEFSVSGPDATVISIKSTEADQNRIISVDGGTGTDDNLTLLLEGNDGKNGFVISTPAGECYKIISNGEQLFSSNVTFNDDVIFDFSSKPLGSEPFQIKGKQGNGGTGSNLLKLVRKDTGDQIRYYGGITFEKEIATKEYVDSILGTLDLSQVEFIPIGAIQFWASATNVPDGWFKLDGSTFDITLHPELHTYLEGTLNYQEGVLPNYTNRFAVQKGNINDGSPGELIEDKSKKPTNLKVNTKSINFSHTHTITITGTGSHSHSVSIGGGDHTHTYGSWGTNKDGGGTGTSNPNTYSSSRTVTGGGHTHTITVTGSGSHTHTYTMQSAGAGTSAHSHTITGGDTTTRPLSVVGYWIIKN